MSAHVFITTKFLDRCVETGLFGVTPTGLQIQRFMNEFDNIFQFDTSPLHLDAFFTHLGMNIS